jgi:hypothetical protein
LHEVALHFPHLHERLFRLELARQAVRKYCNGQVFECDAGQPRLFGSLWDQERSSLCETAATKIAIPNRSSKFILTKGSSGFAKRISHMAYRGLRVARNLLRDPL